MAAHTEESEGRKRGLTVWQIPLDEIHTIAGFNPRTRHNTMDVADLKDYMRSPRNRRNLPPIRLVKRGSKLYLIQGHRRLRAARELTQEGEVIPYLHGIIEPDADEYTLLAGALAENQGMNLTPIEEARAFLRMVNKGGWNVQEIAAHIGKSPTHVYNRLKLVESGKKVQSAVEEGMLSATEALKVIKQARQRGVTQASVLKTHQETKYNRARARSHRGTDENYIRGIVGPLIEEFGVDLVIEVIQATPAFFAEGAEPVVSLEI